VAADAQEVTQVIDRPVFAGKLAGAGFLPAEGGRFAGQRPPIANSEENRIISSAGAGQYGNNQKNHVIFGAKPLFSSSVWNWCGFSH